MHSAPHTLFLSLGPIRLAYAELGVGRAVLLAHGLMSSRVADARQGLTDFSAVARRARLVAYDARGHGQSSGTQRADDYTWRSLADDMLALADHVSPEAPVCAIGLSMGTGTLLHAALQRPERFDRLVLTAPPRAWELRAALPKANDAMAARVERTPARELAKVLQAMPIPPIFRDVLPEEPPPPDVPHALLPSVLRGAGQSNLPARAALRALRKPTLILAWDTDPAHPVASAQALHELIPGSQLHVSRSVQDIRSWGDRAARFIAP